MECKICLIKVSKILICGKCKESACLECNKRYFLENENIKCMHCYKDFNFDEIKSKFPASDVKIIRTHKINMYKKIETGFDTTTEKNVRKKVIDKLIRSARPLFNPNSKLYDLNEDNFIKVTKALKTIVNLLANDKGNVETKPVEENKYKCVRCQAKISKDGECAICNLKTCLKCFEEEKDNHVCNEDIIKSIELLKANSKQCPVCSVNISKVEGCDQMWCTNCKTPFSWKTGVIVNSRDPLHNPHYLEWRDKCRMKKKDILNFIEFQDDNDVVNAFIDCMENIIHYVNNHVPDKVKLNEKARLEFKLKQITEAKYEEKLFRNYKKYEFDVRANEIFTKFTVQGYELIQAAKELLESERNSETANKNIVNDIIKDMIRNIINIKVEVAKDIKKLKAGYGYTRKLDAERFLR